MAIRTHLWGEADDDVSAEALDTLVDELHDAEPEHPDVSVTHESGWCLSGFPSGLVVWENVEDGSPHHRREVPRSDLRRLFGLLASGRLADVERYGWEPGYG